LFIAIIVLENKLKIDLPSWYVYNSHFFTVGETKKWTKYLDEADDRGDNSDDSETVEDEMYTTDQKKYDSYHKQARRCKKRYINSLPLIKSPILQ
jgi:hypothetical protein